MVKKLALICFMFLLAGLVSFVVGCGSSGGGDTVTVTASTTTTTAAGARGVTISGAVVAQVADLADLGITALSVGGENQTEALRALGVNAQDVYGIVRPMAVDRATITLRYVNSDGSYTSTSATAEVRNGAYTIEAAVLDPARTYVVTVSRQSSTTGMVLEMSSLVDTRTATSAAYTCPVNARRDLVLRTIVSQIMEEVSSVAGIDAAMAAQLQTIITSALNAAIDSGLITIPSMTRLTTERENTAARNAAEALGNTDEAGRAVTAGRMRARFSSASTTDEAVGIVRDAFIGLIGDPRFIPDSVITALAQQLLAGTTKTIQEFATACSSNLFNDSYQPVSGVITTSALINELNRKLGFLYGTSMGTLDARAATMLAVFPEGIWRSATISSTTVLNIPQMIFMMDAAMQLSRGQGNLNPAGAMNALFGGNIFTNGVEIMGKEVRIVSFFDPSDPTAGDRAALEVRCQVGNMLNQDPSQLSGITATLTYLSTTGARTVNMREKSFSASPPGGSPPPGAAPVSGEKQFIVTPFQWGGVTPEVITDAQPGTATIRIFRAGTAIGTATATVLDVANFRRINIVCTNPTQTFSPSGATIFPVGSSPVLTWVPTVDGASYTSLIPSGYSLAYALMVFRQSEGGGGGGGTPIFQSWTLQQFITNTNFPWSSTGQSLTAGTYNLEITPILLSLGSRFPMAEGRRTHTTFRVGTSTEVTAGTGPITIEGTVTPPGGASTSNIRVGVFAVESSSPTMTSIVPPVALSSSNTFRITLQSSNFTAQGGYQVRAWSDDGDNILEAPAYGGGSGGGTEFFAPCPKNIFNGFSGLETFDPAIGRSVPLRDRPTGFNITMWAPPPSP
ncbi:hypothetical protein HZB07_05570 [Candidatus Saganbacteria bacterium]|nr:hypothetical protein [Candidatus Saganbacteria bacterium]